MKLLFDQNLSHRLASALSDLFPDSAQVRALGLDRAEDTAVWRYAAEHGYAIVTLDSDFADLSALWGAPPKILWLRCGNHSTADVEMLLRKHALRILTMDVTDGLDCLEID